MPIKRSLQSIIGSVKRRQQNQNENAESDYTESEPSIIDNIVEFIKKHEREMNEQYYSVKTLDGLDKTLDIYETIEESEYYKELMRISVVVLTANYFESEIFNLNAFNTYCGKDKKIKKLKNGLSLFQGSRIVNAYILQMNEYYVLHLHAPETGSNTPCGSSDLARYVFSCDFLNPSCIVSFGICFGINPGQQSIGNTIIAEKLYPWSVGLKISNDNWQVKSDDYIINLRKHFSVLYNNIEEKARKYKKPNSQELAIMGNMITSEAVLSSEIIKQQAVNRSHGCMIIGGEMEGYGLAMECVNYSKTPCVILKAICDWGAVKDIDRFLHAKLVHYDKSINYKDRIQAYAAQCAYQFLDELFKNNLFEKRDLIDSVCMTLLEKYQADYAISKDALASFIDQALRDLFSKYDNLPENRKRNLFELVTRMTIDQCLIEDDDQEMYAFQY